jgi:U3 small nucleolar RNA-associated protein 5
MNLLLPMPSAVLCASSTKAHLVDLKTQRITHTFDGAKNELHGLVASKSDQHSLPASFLAAAESDRYLNIISMKSGQIIGTLVAGDDVVSLAAADHPEAEDTRAVAVVTKLGDVQVFQSPFDMEKSSANSTQSTSLKHGRTVPKPQRPTASVTVTRPGKGEATVPVFNVSFDGDDLVVVWTEGGAGLGFGRLPWRQSEDGDLLLRGETQIQGHMVGQLAAAAVNGIKELGRVRVDESHAVIAKGSQMDDVSMAIDGPEVIDISSGEEVEEGEESEAEDRDREQVHVNGAHHGDTEMEDAMPDGGEEAEKDDPDAAPSFGDLARANALDVIDVEASFADPDPQSVVRHGESAPKPPSGMSLFNVLKQSLRTDDNNLLEGCFHVKDFDIIRTTIERLDSSLASILLQKIAEKFHQKPGRARSLMVWIQWTMVCHGGYLLSQESVKNKLAALHRVVKVRADALAPLLALKGKLDMLEAQASLRRSMQSRVGKEDTGDEEEDGVIYVEGQHDSDSESDDSRSDTSHPAMVGRQLLGNGHESARRDDGDSDEDVEEASTAMSMAVEDSDEDSDEEDSGSEGHGLIDDEASESDDAADEELLAGEIDYDDVDSDGDEDSEADAPKAKTRDQPRLANGTSRKRK